MKILRSLNYSSLAKYTSILIALYFIFLHLYSYSTTAKLGNDVVAWALPAQAAIEGRGVAYLDYWDIKPPGLILFTQLWIFIFGTNIQTFFLLHSLLIVICLIGMIRIFSKLFSPELLIWFSLITTIVFLSPRIQTQFLASELYALAFSVIALNILIESSVSMLKRLFIASILFVFAGQMKDPFALTIMAVIPVLMAQLIKEKRLFIKALLVTFSGIGVAILFYLAYLMIDNNLIAYQEVMLAKQKVFALDKIELLISRLYPGLEFPHLTFFYLPYSLTHLLLIVFIVYIMVKQKLKEFITNYSPRSESVVFNLEFSASSQATHRLAVIFFAIGSWIGFSVQSKFGQHYDIQAVFSNILLLSIPLTELLILINKKVTSFHHHRLVHLMLVGVIIILTFPKKEYFLEYVYSASPKAFLTNIATSKNEGDFRLEQEINAHTNEQSCIMHVYGWGTGATYFYAKRQPCTRFFIPNILTENYYQEYSSALVSNPPSAIVYERGNADMDINRFEATVFNFSQVLEHCYIQSSSYDMIYYPKLNGRELQHCLELHK